MCVKTLYIILPRGYWVNKEEKRLTSYIKMLSLGNFYDGNERDGEIDMRGLIPFLVPYIIIEQ